MCTNIHTDMTIDVARTENNKQTVMCEGDWTEPSPMDVYGEEAGLFHRRIHRLALYHGFLPLRLHDPMNYIFFKTKISTSDSICLT